MRSAQKFLPLLFLILLVGSVAAQSAPAPDPAAQIAQLQQQIADAKGSADNAWMLTSAALVVMPNAPVLWIASEDNRPFSPTSVPGELERRAAMMPNLTCVRLAETSHDLHHDKPVDVSRLIKLFIANPADPQVVKYAMPPAAEA